MALPLEYTNVVTVPYDFEVIDFSGSGAEELDISLLDTGFINTIGSIAVTLWSVLESVNILVILAVVIVALAVLWWLFSMVMDRPIVPTLNVSGVVDAGVDVYEAYHDTQAFYLDQEIERLEARRTSFLTDGQADSRSINRHFDNEIGQLRGRQSRSSRQLRAARSGATAFKRIGRLR